MAPLSKNAEDQQAESHAKAQLVPLRVTPQWQTASREIIRVRIEGVEPMRIATHDLLNAILATLRSPSVIESY